jgi:hypothetical protein
MWRAMPSSIFAKRPSQRHTLHNLLVHLTCEMISSAASTTTSFWLGMFCFGGRLGRLLKSLTPRAKSWEVLVLELMGMEVRGEWARCPKIEDLGPSDRQCHTSLTPLHPPAAAASPAQQPTAHCCALTCICSSQ